MADLERIRTWHVNPDNKQPALYHQKNLQTGFTLHPPCWAESLGNSIERIVFSMSWFSSRVWKNACLKSKIFLRDKRFPVQAGSRPCQWGPLGWHSPRECHQSPREQMAVPYLPAQGRASTACRIPHAIPVKKAQIRLCLTPIQPNRKPHFPVLFGFLKHHLS